MSGPLVALVEPGPSGGAGSMGARLLVTAMRDGGCEVIHVGLRSRGGQMTLVGVGGDGIPNPGRRPDAIYVSALYPRALWHLPRALTELGVEPDSADRPDSAPLVALGGQMAHSPSAALPAVDVVALGDGETTGPPLAWAAMGGRKAAQDWAAERQGYYVPGVSDRLVRVEDDWAPRLVSAGKAMTMELARGCGSRCAFCPIGWAGGSYREATPSQVDILLQFARGRRLNLYAPDFSSVQGVAEIEASVRRWGCTMSGRDARIDRARRHLAHGVAVKSYSFGIEGASERLRDAIGKPLAGGAIVDTMRYLGGQGVGTVKWYLIAGLPGEEERDYDELYATLQQTRAVYAGRLEVTMTIFQPVPHTPLGWDPGSHSTDAYRRVMGLRTWLRDEYDRGGRSWICSQPKGPDLHESDVYLQRGDEGAWGAIRWVDGSLSRVDSGAWRDHAPGLSAALGQIAPGSEPWSYVDVGQRAGVLAEARRQYTHRLSRARAPDWLPLQDEYAADTAAQLEMWT